MKYMIKTLRRGCGFLLCLLFCMIFLSSCQTSSRAVRPQSDKLKIVTTIFPPYDFAREIAGDHAEISMLLSPGMESHTYEPSPADITRIENCDLFIYNGGESDVWVDDLLETIDVSQCRVIRMVDVADTLEEEYVEGIQGAHEHDHGAETAHDHDGEEMHDHEEAEEIEYDEHVWTSPKNAMKIAMAIADACKALKPDDAAFYQERLDAYVKDLSALDTEIREVVRHGKNKWMIFGDRFPFLYFAKEYGLTYRAAFPGCSAESEPSAKTVAYLIDKIKEEKITHVFYIEFSNQKLAQTLREETGVEMLLFHSCHNLSKDEMESGCTYISLMRQNVENLKEALGYGVDSMQ